MKRKAIYITSFQAKTLLTVVDNAMGDDYHLYHAIESHIHDTKTRREVRLAWADLRPALARIAALKSIETPKEKTQPPE